MSIYAESFYPVRSDLEEIHARQIAALGSAGTWGIGAQKLAIVQEARAARVAAGVQEASEEPGVNDADLPEPARKLARQLAVRPQDFDHAFYQQSLDDGLTDASYTEIVGLVSRSVNFDVFSRGIGLYMVPLPEARPGKASGWRPSEAVQEAAWVPTIPNGPAGGEAGKELYGGHFQPWIVRSLSLVPDEMRAHVELEEVQYLPLWRFMEMDYEHHKGFSRSQVETVAARVSAFNECFY